jgi:hypothetical protein
MKNILIKLIKNKNKCTHRNALINSNIGYCPDCGQYLIKNYYIIRCASCNIKREAKLAWGEIIPAKKFCQNCGTQDYYIEKIDSVNFIDANYAIYLKEIANEKYDLHVENQIWVEKENEIIKQLTVNQPSV